MGISDEKKIVQVLFPCISGLAKGQLVTINCFPSDELKGTIKVVTGIDEEIARRVIGASRFKESDSRAGMGVMALFSNPLFSGESYGLALAIADKLARFDMNQQWVEVYATGTVPADGCGIVSKIDGFAEKLDLLIEQAKPGSLFIYPKNNLPSSSDTIQEKLYLLQNKGVKCISIATIDDLAGKLWPSKTDNSGRNALNIIAEKVVNIPGILWKPTLCFVLIGLACFLIYLVFQAPIEETKPKLANQHINTDKKELLEVKEIFSHQEIKQEERIFDTSKSRPHELSDTTKKVSQDTGVKHQVPLESKDTDSSLY